MRNYSPIYQALVITFFSLFIGLTFNLFRYDSKGISLKAGELESAEDKDLLSGPESFIDISCSILFFAKIKMLSNR